MTYGPLVQDLDMGSFDKAEFQKAALKLLRVDPGAGLGHSLAHRDDDPAIPRACLAEGQEVGSRRRV